MLAIAAGYSAITFLRRRKKPPAFSGAGQFAMGIVEGTPLKK